LTTGVSLQVDPETLRPLVEQIVREALAQLDSARVTAGDRLAYSESEAARLLGLRPHQLRDARLRGEIGASIGPGRKILYRHADLEQYLLQRRWEKNGQTLSH
jgi:hypothetical protein